METFVRGATVDAILDANRKVDRALRGAAGAIGAGLEVTTLAGYLPLAPNGMMLGLYGRNAERVVDPTDIVADLGHRGGSTDMGDISQIMPAIHPYAGGARGAGHGSDYEIVDYETAAIVPAKCMAMTLVDLLTDDAAQARQVLSSHTPALTRDGYLRLLRELEGEERIPIAP
jgi:metal-dependent amidase/aminoacylase/carboxypeptidase family protein